MILHLPGYLLLMKKMEYIVLFGYLIVISISLISILVAFYLYNKYSLKFYRTFAYLIISGNLFALLAFLGNSLTGSILRNQPVEIAVKSKFQLVLNFMSMPFFLLIIFFLITFFREIFGKPVTTGLKKICLSGGFILAVLATIMYIENFGPDPSAMAKPIRLVLNWVGILIFFSSISQGFFYLKGIKDLQHRRILFFFTLIFLGLFIFLAITVLFIKGVFTDFVVLLPWELIFIIYMVKKMNPFYLFQPFSHEASRRLDRIYEKYNITIREQEIITLICRGKTNRDIEDALYISLQTVKNNIYNIFKKLKVKNRVELINFIRLQSSSLNSSTQDD